MNSAIQLKSGPGDRFRSTLGGREMLQFGLFAPASMKSAIFQRIVPRTLIGRGSDAFNFSTRPLFLTSHDVPLLKTRRKLAISPTCRDICRHVISQSLLSSGNVGGSFRRKIVDLRRVKTREETRKPTAHREVSIQPSGTVGRLARGCERLERDDECAISH
jgi:hypothetical protein